MSVRGKTKRKNHLEPDVVPIFRTKRLEKFRSQQQRDIACSFETEGLIGRLLEARSDAISQRRRSGVAPEVASWGAPSRCCYLGR